MRYSRAFIFLCLLVLLVAPNLAQASVVADTACTSQGVSVMTTDQKNIVVCLPNDSGSLIWKAITSASLLAGTLCGMAVGTTTTDNESGYSETSYGNVAACNGTNIVSGSTFNCPTGYTVKSGSNLVFCVKS